MMRLPNTPSPIPRRNLISIPHWLLIMTGWMLLITPLTAFADEALDQFNLAHQHVQQGQHEQAINALENAINAYPHFAEAHHLLGLVYFTGLQQPEKAIAALKQAVTYYPNFARAHMDLGTVLHHQQNMTEAEAAFQKAVTLYPRFLEAQLALANLYDQTTQTQKAITAYTSALQLKPDQTDVLYKLAYWHHQAGDEQHAHAMLNRLQQADPNHLESWLLQGEIFETERQPDRAIEAYEQALTIKGDLLAPHHALGFLYQDQGKSEQAAAHFSEVVKLDPNNPEAHLNFGVILAGLKQLDDAEREYQTAISLEPNLTEGYYNLGVFYEFHRKDTDRALVQYQAYLQHGGTDERISKLVKKLRP